MSAISELSALYAAYIKGWDAALLRAAFIFDGAERDAILSLLKGEKDGLQSDFPGPTGRSFL